MDIRITLSWLGSWLALLAFSILVTEGMHYSARNADTAVMQTSLALSVSWLATLLMPVGFDSRVRPHVVLLWAGLAAVGFLLLLPLTGEFGRGAGVVQLLGGVLTLVLLFSALHMLILCFTTSRFVALTLVSLIVLVFLAAPVYLGGLAEQFSNRTLVANFIVAASPLSYLAGIIEYDYLRTTWFYQNTSFGGLRFEYPAAGVMTVMYLVIAMAMLAFTAIRKPSNMEEKCNENSE